jgi:phosphohistidine swiveling domain-containing protein
LPEDRSPRAGADRQAAARTALEEKLRASAEPGNDLFRLLEMAQQYLPNLEDHNLLCDQRVGAAMRERWLRVGSHLQKRGMRSADDVFYYRRPELIATLEGGEPLPQAVLDERRAFVAALAVNPPPARLGRAASEGDARQEPQTQVRLKGIGASKGVYTGRARVIETLEEAGRLERGDVLVCRMTSPPWSPLFATAGALVVNTGGMLSHGAVVAREFGIPAVVATVNATSVIPDGATITVDGDAGIVTVEAS